MNLRRVLVLLTLSLSLGALSACGGAPPQGRVPTDNQLTKFHPPDREDLLSRGNKDSGWGSLDDSSSGSAGKAAASTATAKKASASAAGAKKTSAHKSAHSPAGNAAASH